MKFVLMVPLRRCGSNAIRLRMNLHPDFYSPYPLHLCDMKEEGKTYTDDLDYFQLIVDMVGLQRHSLVSWEDLLFDPVEIFKNIKDKPRSIYKIYWEMLSQVGKKKNARVVMDKCQDSVCDFEEMIGLFPEMLFLDVVRDPRAQISSMNDAIIYDFDTQLNTLRWVEARKWSDRIHEKYPNKILTIRYEDFILSHEETMRQICRFVGIGFDPVILDVEKSREAFIMSQTSPLWETNYSMPIPGYINKYMNNLSRLEIEQIENKTIEWMKKYNYAPITAHKSPFFYSIKQATGESEEKKVRIWEALRKKHPHDYILRKSRMRYINSVKKNL